MPNYRLYVSWSIGADVAIEADTKEEAIEKADKMGLHEFNHDFYIEDSFRVDEITVEGEERVL